MQVCVSQVLHKAEQYCQHNQQRFTPNRREVLRVLAESSAPMSAYEILDAMHPSSTSVKPPTVYRALKFLLDAGLIHNIESSKYLISRHKELPSRHYLQLLICQSCHQVFELPLAEPLLNHLNQAAAQVNFNLFQHNIELHGLCADCSLEGSDVDNG